MVENTCKTCSYKYHDDFCMNNCSYVNDNHTCKAWTDKELEFSYEVIYRLCKQYIKTCDMYNEHKKLIEKYPDDLSLKLSNSSFEFFFNCCLNDLHREMSLWKTRR